MTGTLNYVEGVFTKQKTFCANSLQKLKHLKKNFILKVTSMTPYENELK